MPPTSGQNAYLTDLDVTCDRCDYAGILLVSIDGHQVSFYCPNNHPNTQDVRDQ